MMAAAPGRRRGVKILLGLLGALALGFAILLIGIEIAAGRHWKEMGNGIRSLVAEAAAHEARRPSRATGGTIISRRSTRRRRGPSTSHRPSSSSSLVAPRKPIARWSRAK